MLLLYHFRVPFDRVCFLIPDLFLTLYPSINFCANCQIQFGFTAMASIARLFLIMAPFVPQELTMFACFQRRVAPKVQVMRLVNAYPLTTSYPSRVTDESLNPEYPHHRGENPCGLPRGLGVYSIARSKSWTLAQMLTRSSLSYITAR